MGFIGKCTSHYLYAKHNQLLSYMSCLPFVQIMYERKENCTYRMHENAISIHENVWMKIPCMK